MADQTLKALLDQHIQATVIEALQGSPAMVEALIKSTMSEPVDPDTGSPPRYSSDKAVPWLQYQTGRVIRMAVEQAIVTAMTSRRDELQAAVMAAIRTDEVAGALARSLVAKADEGNEWRWKFDIKMAEETE